MAGRENSLATEKNLASPGTASGLFFFQRGFRSGTAYYSGYAATARISRMAVSAGLLSAAALLSFLDDRGFFFSGGTSGPSSSVRTPR